MNLALLIHSMNEHPSFRFFSSIEMSKVLGSSKDTMVYAFTLALQDDVVLVQRGMLELLVVHFPMRSSFFSHEQSVKLFMAAVMVVQRRDISLTRRLYAWFLGSNGLGQETVGAQMAPLAYFELYSQKALVHALQVRNSC